MNYNKGEKSGTTEFSSFKTLRMLNVLFLYNVDTSSLVMTSKKFVSNPTVLLLGPQATHYSMKFIITLGIILPSFHLQLNSEYGFSCVIPRNALAQVFNSAM